MGFTIGFLTGVFVSHAILFLFTAISKNANKYHDKVYRYHDKEYPYYNNYHRYHDED